MKHMIWTALMAMAMVLGSTGVASAQSGDTQFDEEVRKLGEAERARRIVANERRREVALEQRSAAAPGSHVTGQVVGGLIGGVTLAVGATAVQQSVCYQGGGCGGGLIGTLAVAGVGYAMGTSAGVAIMGPRDAAPGTHMAAFGGAGAGLLAGAAVGLATAVAMPGNSLESAATGVLTGGVVTLVAVPVLATAFHQDAYAHQLTITPTFRKDGGGFAMSGRF